MKYSFVELEEFVEVAFSKLEEEGEEAVSEVVVLPQV